MEWATSSGRDRPMPWQGALGIGSADDLAAAHAAARQHHAEGPRPVIAPLHGVDARRPPELGQENHQRRIEPAALIEVLHQRRETPVERRQHLAARSRGYRF